MRKISMLFALLLTTAAAFADALFSNGKSEWTIGVSAKADPAVISAANELANALSRVAGFRFEVSNKYSPERKIILLGTSSAKIISNYDLGLDTAMNDEEICVIKRTDPNLIVISGNTPRAVLDAAYAFLYKFIGVRFIWPGESGAFYPKLATWEIPDTLDWKWQPSIRYRGFHLCGDWYDVDNFRTWMSRNFINSTRHVTTSMPQYAFTQMIGGHIMKVTGKDMFETHPEYFSLINGERYKDNICLTSDGALDFLTDKLNKLIEHNPKAEFLHLFLEDNLNFCECPDCKKLGNVSERFYYCYNRLAKRLHEAHPEIKITPLAYSGYRPAPKGKIEASSMIEYATHDRCNNHLLSNRNCPWNVDQMKQYALWKEKGLPIGQYTYEFDIYTDKGCAQFVPLFRIIEDNVKTAVKWGHVWIIPEVSLSPGEGPETEVSAVLNRLPISFYAQMMWDSNLTVTDWLNDTCKTVWGPAWRQMVDYFSAMDFAWSAISSHTLILKHPGSQAGFITPQVEAKARRAFEEARSLLENGEETLADYPAFSRTRALEALEREEYLFERWRKLANIKRGTSEAVQTLAADAPQMAQWIGAPSRDKSRTNNDKDAWAKKGWKATITADDRAFCDAAKTAKLIYLRHPGGENPLSERAWHTVKTAVRNGATCVCTSYWKMPLDKTFGDSYAVSVVSLERVSVSSRRYKDLYDGEWLMKPNDLTKAFKEGIGACYVYQPAEPKKWEILATQYSGEGKPAIPSVFYRKFGEGKIAVACEAPSVNIMNLLQNLQALE